MIAVRLFGRNEYGDLLRQFGCELVETFNDQSEDKFFHSAYWRTSWGHHFTVPEIGPDRMCPAPQFYEILAELSQLDAEMKNSGRRS